MCWTWAAIVSRARDANCLQIRVWRSSISLRHGAIPREVREMSRANGLWGAPRMLKLGIEVAQSTVGKYIIKPPDDRAELDDLPAQPCCGHCRHGPVRRADDRLQAGLLPGASCTRPERVRSPR